MPLSDLAEEIYAILRQRVPSRTPEITYRELVESLPPLGKPFEDVHWRDARLDQALGDIVNACRAAGLPALSAIVVNSETGYPGRQYYPMAYPGVTDEDQQQIQWANEFEKIKTTTFPPSI